MQQETLDAAGTRLAASGAVLGLMGIGIRLARPDDIGWGGAAIALVWGGCAIAAGLATLRRRTWGPRLAIPLLCVAILALGALSMKVAGGPDRWSALAGVSIVTAVLSLVLITMAREAAMRLKSSAGRASTQA